MKHVTSRGRATEYLFPEALEAIETGVATQPKTDLSCGDARPSWPAGLLKHLNYWPWQALERNFTKIKDLDVPSLSEISQPYLIPYDPCILGLKTPL